MREKNKTIWIILILAVLLVVALGYIAADKYMDARLKKETDIFDQGAQYGYSQAILQIMQQAATCQAVPLYAENTTISMVAVECLQQGTQQPENMLSE